MIWNMLRDLLTRFATPPAGSDAPVAGGNVDHWAKVLRAAGFTHPDLWAGLIAEPARRYHIAGRLREAAFAATVAHESGGGARLVESLNYNPTGLVKIWPSRFTQADAGRMGRTDGKPADEYGIAERAYGGRMGNGPEGSGDGFRYRGRGLIQLTGKDAYNIAADAVGLPLVAKPEMAAEPRTAAEVACWTWAVWKRCNPLADAENVEGWRRAINGGLNGLDDVRQRYRAALRVG